MAMVFYGPPLLPGMSTLENALTRLDISNEVVDFELLDRLDAARLPVQYLANLFSVGDEQVIRRILRKLYAVRLYMRRKTVEQVMDADTLAALAGAGCTQEEAEAIYRLTTLPNLAERFVLPPYHREMAVESWKDPLVHKGEVGVGYIQPPKRGE